MNGSILSRKRHLYEEILFQFFRRFQVHLRLLKEKSDKRLKKKFLEESIFNLLICGIFEYFPQIIPLLDKIIKER
jgi:hypothetical protein